MPIKQIFLTAEGLKAMEEELELLKTVKRKEIAERIKIALGYGDLSENSEYDEAKNEQGQLEGRIAELEARLKNAVIIDDSELDSKTVKLGSRVRVLDVEFESEELYHIVGSTEADPLKQMISDESPVGRALIGHLVNDTVDVDTPDGIAKYVVLEIIK
ncbi:MAG: transcription elongation factor GreA [Oscillospiraceae bacterium]|jgi:transcription elongation factor GreA|nr:transcription elongation factor GreA [Oscillospiraceae bacterium]